MRHDGRGNSYVLLFLLLVAAFLGCSCKSIDARVSEDGKALANAGERIKSEHRPAIKSLEESLKTQRDVSLSLQTLLDVCKEDNKKKEQVIENLSKVSSPKPSPSPSPEPPRR